MAVPKFEDLIPALSSEALSAVESFGFHHTTPVQAATIPLFLSHKVFCPSRHVLFVTYVRMFVFKQQQDQGKLLHLVSLSLKS
jgi:hypothetical protein